VVFDQIDREGRKINIWVDELAGGVPARFTFSPAADQLPIWTQDGGRITFGSNRSFHFTVYQKNSDGSGAETQVIDLDAPQQSPWDWSRDGKYLLLMKNEQLWYLSASDWQPKPFIQTKGTIRNAQFSPDGKWVAYSSNETGSSEVYVSAFSNPLSKRQISRGGGQEPRWRRDGKELFYLSADAKLMAVPVKAGATFESGPPEALFQTHARLHIGVMDAFSYDVTRDGQRFLINVKIDDPSPAPLAIVLNWASEMEK